MVRAALVLALVALCSCAARKSIVVSAAEAPAGPPLERSLFAQRGSSGLSEEEIARILDAPLELKLPARVGLAVLGQPFTPSSPHTPEAGLAASRAIAEALEGSKQVTVASDIDGELPTGGGLEGLRELAARYRVPYLLLYTERFEDRTHANGFAALWITVLGGLFTPSQTLRGEGLLSVSMLDVRTGTLLFTLHERVRFERMHLPILAGVAYRDLQREAADRAAQELARRVLEKFERLARSHATEPVGAQARGSAAPRLAALPAAP